MTDHLTRALAAVLHDLDAVGAPLPTVEPSNWQDWPTAESAFLRSSVGWAMGVWVDTALAEGEQLAMLAEQVQEFVVEDLPAHHLPSNWPQCPDHPVNHPMSATVRGGVAVWTCPHSNRLVAAIGDLDS